MSTKHRWSVVCLLRFVSRDDRQVTTPPPERWPSAVCLRRGAVLAKMPSELVMRVAVQLPAPHDGRADVALLTMPFDGHGIDSELLATGPRLVVLAASDPLAARSGLRLSDLDGRLLASGAPAEEGMPKPPFDHHEPLDHSQIFSLVEVAALSGSCPFVLGLPGRAPPSWPPSCGPPSRSPVE